MFTSSYFVQMRDIDVDQVGEEDMDVDEEEEEDKGWVLFCIKR